MGLGRPSLSYVRRSLNLQYFLRRNSFKLTLCLLCASPSHDCSGRSCRVPRRRRPWEERLLRVDRLWRQCLPMASGTQHRFCVHTHPAGVPLLQKQKRRQTAGLKKIGRYDPKMFFYAGRGDPLRWEVGGWCKQDQELVEESQNREINANNVFFEFSWV